jgi:hypothetical protein
VDFADRTLWKYAYLTELGLSATQACRNMAPASRGGREATISIGIKAELEFLGQNLSESLKILAPESHNSS